MRKPYYAVLAALCCFALAACGDRPDRLPSAPTLPPEIGTAPPGGNTACGTGLALDISSTISALFSGSERNAASSRFNDVKQACRNNKPLALEHALGLIQFSIDVYRLGNITDLNGGDPPTPEESLSSLFDMLFVYVGQPAPGLDPSVFGDGSAIGVIGAEGGDLKTGLLTAGLRVPATAVTASKLFTINPEDPGCLVTNHPQAGVCFDFSAFPQVASFNATLTVVLCLPGGVPPNTGLGHLVAPGRTVVTPPATNPFTDLCPDESLGLRPRQRDGVVGAGVYALERLASRLLAALSPRPLYASHSYVAGGVRGLSPFDGLGLRVFQATFTNDVIGQPPGAPDIGTFTQVVQPPGSILVQASLADLLNQPVVLSQGGGNCDACGGLELAGTMFTASSSPATNGIYTVVWRWVQDRPAPKDAPIVIRDAVGREIARLSIAKQGSQNRLRYNGNNVGSWTQSVHQLVEITVNLDTKKTALRVDNVTLVSSANFVNNQASSLARVAAEFSGIDAGVVGWDDVTVTREPDPLQ
jgi:hypothetical protein